MIFFIIGYFALILDNKYYSVCRMPARIQTEPDLINTIKIRQEEYTEFLYHKGSNIISNTNVIKNKTLIYPIYDEFISNAKVPWYINYRDLGALLENDSLYAGVKMGNNRAVFELIVATISRDAKDLNKYYRHEINSMDELNTKPSIVKLMDVTYSATNTTAKLIGGYWEDGLTSALITPTEELEDIEALLRA